MDLQKDYNLYLVFIKVCEIKNYSKVADLLGYYSHQSISEKMSALAQQVGIKKLFQRSSKGVEPTSEAIDLYNRVKPLFDAIDFAENDVKEFNENSSTVIRMAMPSTVSSYNLRMYLKEFCKQYPKVRFEFYKKDSFELLSKKKIDFIVGADSILKSHTFQTRDLFTDQYIFVASRDFLEKRNISNKITKEELLELPAIVHQHFLKDLTSKTGLSIKPHMIAETTEQVRFLSEDGFGVGFYFKGAFDNLNNNHNLVVLDVEGVTLPEITAVCAYNDGYLTKAAKAFIKGLFEFFNIESA